MVHICKFLGAFRYNARPQRGQLRERGDGLWVSDIFDLCAWDFDTSDIVSHPLRLWNYGSDNCVTRRLWGL